MMKDAIRTAILVLSAAAAASAQTPAGGQFRANTYTTGAQNYARAAMEADGDFVVVWTSYGEDGDDFGVFGQRFAASGARRGGEFQVNTYTTGYQGAPAVAVGSSGSFVVVWHSAPNLAALSVEGQRYDPAGNPIGAEFFVNTLGVNSPGGPQVALAADGRFVVSWFGWGVDGSYTGIAGRRFDASGNAVGSDFVVNTYTTGGQFWPDLAVDANGSFVAVWEDGNDRDGSSSAIFGQRFDASGNRLGTDFRVNSYTTGRQTRPSISVSPAGGFVVAWTSEFGDGSVYSVFARRFDVSGNALGNDFIATTNTAGHQTGFVGQVAHDARGNFVVTWSSPGDGSSYGPFAQRFNASGTRRGAEFQVNTYTTGLQLWPSIASDPVGNFVILWASRYGDDGSDFGVFAQRFGGLGPAALAVDSAGNLVLEPGETIDVRPSWRNTNTVAQTFTGALSALAGPPGATYTITDATGDYGTVPSEGLQQCTDCYGVSISNPSPRPAVHWDASVVEGLAAPTPGQQKQWVLHVGDSFTDVPTANPFYRFIETLLHHGVTGGCSPTQYCPATSTTRDQMAVFVLVAKEGTGYVPPACTTPMFADVPASSPFCRWIEELARRAVVGGCGGGNYCPASAVTREQMAVFVLRTLDPALNPPACAPPNLYADVPETNPFCRWIEELTRRSVVTGCGGGNYCPLSPVTREQMGVFISVTFGLTLYGP